MNTLLPLTDKTRTDKKRGDDNLIPLINIVFLLLIFFMVAGQIRAQLPEAITLPQSQLGNEHQDNTVSLHIDQHRQLRLNGDPTTQQQLTTQLVNLGENPSMAIYADQSLMAKDLLSILLLVDTAGIHKVRLVVRNLATGESL